MYTSKVLISTCDAPFRALTVFGRTALHINPSDHFVNDNPS